METRSFVIIQLRKELSGGGASENFTLHWQTQADGQIFHLVEEQGTALPLSAISSAVSSQYWKGSLQYYCMCFSSRAPGGRMPWRSIGP